jgi:hypothetical protein
MKCTSLASAGFVLILSLLCPTFGASPDPLSMSLAGPWRFQLDRDDSGIDSRLFEKALSEKVTMPADLAAQGIGDDVSVDTKWIGSIVDKSWFTEERYEKYRQPGNVKIPFWLQPEKHYVGAAWYQRDIEIPADWQGKRVVLFLERPHWETRVWLDGKAIGTCNALGTPHEYDLGELAPGKHQLTIRVDNRMVVDVGRNSHSISDHTQGDWNGVVGRIELRAKPTVWIEDLQVYPNLASKTVIIKGRLGLRTVKDTPQFKMAFAILPHGDARAPTAGNPITVSGDTFETRIAVDQVSPWSEFSPDLYDAYAWLDGDSDFVKVTFGFRELSTQGTQFLLNGQKIFIRGTLECCIFPKTGHPPTDVDSWKRIIGVAKAYGLNNLRFHSWCPPEAAFVAADEMGFYFHVECSSWANSSSGLGKGLPIDTWIYEEADRILKYYGNHPSFMLMPYGNEPGGNQVPFLKKWVAHYKAKDPRRLYTSGSGWPEIPENQFHVVPGPRIQAWGQGLKSRINAKPPETTTDYRDYIRARTVPVISHEIGQWCVYPNFDEIPKYTGYLKPRNFEIFRDTLAEHHMADQAKQFLLASGKLQTLCYKEEIESALRTPGMGGFQLLDLHDFPGQGTALVGVLDPFWEDKGYVTATEYSRFCNSTVPLARLSKRVFTSDESLHADIEVAHFDPVPLENAITTWKLISDDGKSMASGQLPPKTIPIDNGIALGSISIPLKNVPAPSRCKLVVGIAGTEFENDWDVWVYPPTADTQPKGVTIADDLDDKTLAALDAGGKVFLLIPPGRVRNIAAEPVKLGFSSIFWNTAWTRRQAPTTLGILCDPKHPALASFPTEFHSNWQWWHLVSRAGAMILDDLPANLRPTVQVIDDWVTAHRLGLVFEANVGKGRVIVCSIDLKNNLDQNPVARQMRHSLLDYMAGDKFKPAVDLSQEQIRSLMAAGLK